MPFADACARSKMASASPDALLICSALSASEAKMVACLRPSATLIAACRAPILHNHPRQRKGEIKFEVKEG